MKFVPNAVTRKVARQILVSQKHSPTILFAAGVTGMVGSTVLACRATLKLEDVLEETQANLNTARTLQHEKYSEEDRKRDLAIIYARGTVKMAKLYGPAFVLGVTSIACLTSSHHILSKRNASLTAAYVALEKGFKEYQQRVEDELGPEKAEEFRYGTEEQEVKDEKTGKTKKVKRVSSNGASVYARFFDEFCRSWNKTPEYNLCFLRAQQNYANDLLRARGHVFLNDVYDLLGIDRSQAGAVVGWIISDEGDNFIDFGIFDGDNDKARDFVNGREGAILLDFNVDGVIFDKI